MSRTALSIFTAAMSALIAQAPAATKVMPVLNQAMADITIPFNSTTTSINLGSHFGTEAIDDQVVRFTSQTSNGSRVLDFALFSTRTPLTRANFLYYVNNNLYQRSIIHRSVPGFVIQGGGYYNIAPGSTPLLTAITVASPVANEYGISNTYSTISMAKSAGNPDSATSQWFVSLGDNSANLDNQNGGFTVFGRVTRGTMPNAAAFGNPLQFPIWNAGGALSSLPLIQSFNNTSPLAATDLVLFESVALANLPADQAGESTTLTYSILSNTNPAVNATIGDGGQLHIDYLPNASGDGTITIRATDSAGNIVDDHVFISVKVFTTYTTWKNAVLSSADAADDNISGAGVDNGSALSNLELFAHGLTPASRDSEAVIFSNTKISTSDYPTFSFPLVRNLSGVSYAIQTSSDLGIADPWTNVPHTIVSQSATGEIDSLVIRTTSARASANAYYRLAFSLTE